MENKEVNKKEGESLKNKGTAAYNKNNYREAVEYLEASSIILGDKFSFFYLAESYSNLKQHQKAIEAYDKTYAVLDKDHPGKEHVLVLKCKAEEEQYLGNFEKSIACYDAALGVAQRYMSPVDFRTFEYEISDAKKAVKRSATDLERKKYTEAFKQAEEMEKRKSYKEAIELYAKCISIQGTAEAYFQKGQCYKATGMLKEAIADYEKCIELRKNYGGKSEDNLHVKCLFNEGMCYLQNGDFKQAVSMMRKAYDKVYFGDKTKEEIERWHKIANERMIVFLTDHIQN